MIGNSMKGDRDRETGIETDVTGKEKENAAGTGKENGVETETGKENGRAEEETEGQTENGTEIETEIGKRDTAVAHQEGNTMTKSTIGQSTRKANGQGRTKRRKGTGAILLLRRERPVNRRTILSLHAPIYCHVMSTCM